jgi:hypothetical protein
VNVLDVLDIELRPGSTCGRMATSIGGFFAEFLVSAVNDPSMRWIDDDWIWDIYHALATTPNHLGEPWIRATFDSDGSLDDLSCEEMANADALLSEAVRARFGQLP